MKTFKKIAAQGEFVIIRIDAIPADVDMVDVDPENGSHIIAHSETGHHHVMDALRVKAFTPKKPDIYTMFLQVDEPTEVQHLRGWDTHESILVPTGNYIVKRQREYTPEGFRKVQD